MLKCEVISNAVIAVKAGSTVIVSEKQFELARKHLKPIEEIENIMEGQQIETADLPKARRTRKK